MLFREEIPTGWKFCFNTKSELSLPEIQTCADGITTPVGAHEVKLIDMHNL